MKEKDDDVELKSYTEDMGENVLLDNTYSELIKREKLVLSNFLVGGFNGDKYLLSKEVCRELVGVNKVLDEMGPSGSMLLKATSKSNPDFSFKFIVTIENDENNKLFNIATLFLLENYTSSIVQTKKNFSSIVAKYKDDNDEFFKGKVLKIFNIHSKDESEGVGIFDENTTPFLLSKFSKHIAYKNRDSAGLEESEKEYFELLLLLLENSGANGLYIIKVFNKLKMDSQFILDGNIKSRYFILASLLDRAISLAGTKGLLPEQLKKINVLREVRYTKYSKTINAPAPVVVAPKNVEQKKPVKSASKSSSKSGSSSSAKKASKKSETETKKKDKKSKIITFENVIVPQNIKSISSKSNGKQAENSTEVGKALNDVYSCLKSLGNMMKLGDKTKESSILENPKLPVNLNESLSHKTPNPSSNLKDSIIVLEEGKSL